MACFSVVKLLQKPETSTLSVIKLWEIPKDFLIKNKEKNLYKFNELS